MLQIIVPPSEEWDEQKLEFITTKKAIVNLEHSLASISLWESKFHKPFINTEDKTEEELRDYIRFMVLKKKPSEEVFINLFSDGELLKKIQNYIDDPMTATTFCENDKSEANGKMQKITSELIYYWMAYFNIPFTCQFWNLNRLLTLIKVCIIKENQSNSKQGMSKAAIYNQNAALNAARRKKINSKG